MEFPGTTKSWIPDHGNYGAEGGGSGNPVMEFLASPGDTEAGSQKLWSRGVSVGFLCSPGVVHHGGRRPGGHGALFYF